MSLIELLVGVLLGATATSGALTAFATGNASYQTSQAQARLNERAQYLQSSLAADLQLAGYYGLNDAALVSVGEALPGGDRLCGPDHLAHWASPVELQDGYTLPCPAQGAGAQPGSDVLTVRRASAQLAEREPGRPQLLTSLTDARARQLLVVAALPAGVALTAGRTELRDLLVHSYYVARRADGSNGGDGTQPALRVKNLTAIAGRVAIVDTEVMPGVEDLQVEAGYRDAASGLLRFVTPAGLSADAKVVALRLTLLLRAERPDPRHVDRRRYRYAGRDYAPADHYHRLLLDQTVMLRNAAPAAS
ncbi:MAG TPA: PilW family protein [Steroidobacteraceae bacterium]|nr:PilW family protein [Steroidobacteraceae bacterium]